MEITFEKRTYEVKDGDDVYQLTEIIKHPLEKYNYKHFSEVLKFKHSDDPLVSGFHYFEPSEELLERLHNYINQNKDNKKSTSAAKTDSVKKVTLPKVDPKKVRKIKLYGPYN